MIKSRKGAAASEATGTRQSSREHILRLSMLALFTALILLMSFTGLGYIKAGIIEISFLMVPVAVGSVLMGPTGGLILGTLFGITSLIQAVSGMSAFGFTLFSLKPLATVVLCLVPRILMGIFAGLIAKAFARSENRILNTGARSVVTCLLTPLFNTVMFMGLLVLFFWQTDYIQGMAGGLNIFPFIIAFVGINGLLEVAASLVIGTAASIALIKVCERMTGKSIL